MITILLAFALLAALVDPKMVGGFFGEAVGAFFDKKVALVVWLVIAAGAVAYMASTGPSWLALALLIGFVVWARRGVWAYIRYVWIWAVLACVGIYGGLYYLHSHDLYKVQDAVDAGAAIAPHVSAPILDILTKGDRKVEAPKPAPPLPDPVLEFSKPLDNGELNKRQERTKRETEVAAQSGGKPRPKSKFLRR